MSPNYNVYVIQLDEQITQHASFCDANPNRDPEKPCVYVGQSVHSPEKRFQQHCDDYRSSRHAHRYGQQLMPDIYQNWNPIPTREEALERESQLAEELRSMGYGVAGGH